MDNLVKFLLKNILCVESACIERHKWGTNLIGSFDTNKYAQELHKCQVKLSDSNKTEIKKAVSRADRCETSLKNGAKIRFPVPSRDSRRHRVFALVKSKENENL